MYGGAHRIIEKNGGTPPLTYHQFQNVVASMDAPPHAEPKISESTMRGCFTPICDDHDEKYGVPTLEELGNYLPVIFFILEKKKKIVQNSSFKYCEIALYCIIPITCICLEYFIS